MAAGRAQTNVERATELALRRRDLSIRTLEDELVHSRSATILSLSTIMDLKDLPTGLHGTRLAEWATRVAELMGVEEAELADLEVAALLHDIGKVGVPDTILNKPGRLTDDEMDVVKKHSEYGWSVLRLLPGFSRVSLFVLHHHERLDGAGYPAGLVGEEIPLGSRIVAVVDAFDAMTSSRPYREGLPVEEALRRLRQDSGTHFDPEVAAVFEGIVVEDLADDLGQARASSAA